MRVDAPSGVSWDVERVWLARPAWSRRKVDLDWPDLSGVEPPVPDLGEGLGAAIAGILLTFAILLILGGILLELAPLLIALIGALVAVPALVARILAVGRWDVIARSGESAVRWQVRGLFRSRRAIGEIATAIRAGREPLVDGSPGERLSVEAP